MKGFTLIESVVVVAILSIIGLVGVNTITEFQRNAILSSAAQEFASTLRVAKENSTSGRVTTGETYTVGGYPFYSVILSGNSYELIRTFTPTAGLPTMETIETHTIDPSITITPASSSVAFTRISGDPNAAVTFTLTRTGTSISRTVTVNGNGLISL